MIIRLAKAEDIDKVEESYKELLTYEKERGGYSQWVLGVYPTREIAQNAYKSNTLYVLEDKGQVCASAILNQEQAPHYKQIKWKYPAFDNEVLVIHTLCVPPSKSGKGYGKAMFKFAVDKARTMECKVLRLDTYKGNEPAKALYTGLGCAISGDLEVLHQGVIKTTLTHLEIKV